MKNTNKKIKSYLRKLEWIKEHIRVKTDFIQFGATNISYASGFVSNLKELLALDISKDLIHKILEDYNKIDELGITSEENAYKIEKDINQLITDLNNIISTLKFILPKEEINSVNIKLPPTYDLDDLSKHSRELHLAISQVIINDQINGQETIHSVANGSIWINVFLGTPVAVSVIAGIFWAAAVIRKKMTEGDFAIEQVKGMKIKNEILKNLQEAHENSIKSLIEAEAKSIQTEYFKDDSNENLLRIENSIKTFTELIYKGVEIQPALSAPEDVSNLFPKSLETIESKIPKISNN